MTLTKFCKIRRNVKLYNNDAEIVDTKKVTTQRKIDPPYEALAANTNTIL